MTLDPAVVGAVVTVIGAVVGAGIRKVWVWGWVYEAQVKETTFWRNLALRAVPLAEKATDVALAEKRDA